jgi:hypothetical protein
MDWENKIAALLAKAERTTPGEAEALTAKAEELIVKFGIERALVDARRATSAGSREQIVTDTLTFSGGYREAYLRLAYGVTRTFGVTGFKTRLGASELRYTMVGFESDVRQLTLLVTSLQLQAITAMRAWCLTDDGRQLQRVLTRARWYQARRQFLVSFADGVADRLRRTVTTVRDDAERTEPGTALVLRDRQQLLDEYVERTYQLRSTRPTRLNGGPDTARANGYRAGQHADVGVAGVGSGERRALTRDVRS